MQHLTKGLKKFKKILRVIIKGVNLHRRKTKRIIDLVFNDREVYEGKCSFILLLFFGI